jgi:plastocyanin
MSNARAGITAVLAAGLLAVSCGGGGGGSYGSGGTTPTSGTPAGSTTGAASTPDVVITIAGMSFSPSNVAVKDGQTVAWKNDDTMAHTATQDGGGFDTGAIAAGATSKPITITGTGAFKYHCTYHPGMTGALNGAADGGTGY